MNGSLGCQRSSSERQKKRALLHRRTESAFPSSSFFLPLHRAMHACLFIRYPAGRYVCLGLALRNSYGVQRGLPEWPLSYFKVVISSRSGEILLLFLWTPPKSESHSIDFLLLCTTHIVLGRPFVCQFAFCAVPRVWTRENVV